MRAIEVNTPKEFAEAISKLANDAGAAIVNVSEVTAWYEDGKRVPKVNIAFETSTPKVKKFIDALLTADFYDRSKIWLGVRERRSIINTDSVQDVTDPWVIPSTDLVQDFYQFSHITWGLIGRVFIAACLLSYGLLN